ncbi:MAG: hypothetical protein H6807_07220 [Planctomycetes bacterium]|nr:hypothetical protein [Planctomycetota bacterium]
MNPEFPASDLAAWKARVERDLGGRDFDRSLVLGNEDGFLIQPVYDASNSAAPAEDAPGAFPYTRGSGGVSPALLVQEYGDSDAEGLRREIERDLEGGVAGVRLRFDRRLRLGLDPLAETTRGCDGVLACELGGLRDLLAPVFERAEAGRPRARLLALAAGAEVLPLAGLTLALRRLEGVAAGDLCCHFALDPFAALARDGRLPRPLDRHLAEGVELAQALDGDDRAIEIDGGVWHERGADTPFELGLVAAALAAWLRAGLAAGCDPAVLARRITLRTATERDVFVAIAKLRALRKLWALVLAHFGVVDVAPLVWATSSRRSLSQTDPWVNLLRTTTQGFAAACGGADLMTILPFDFRADGPMPPEQELLAEEQGDLAAGSPESWQDSSTPLGRRLARNEFLMLDEESGLFRVQDPAGGSYYVESLTERLVEAAFAELKSIEASGGLAAVLDDGSLGEALMSRSARRLDDARHRRLAITGTNEFPVLDDRFRAARERRDERDLNVLRQRLKQHRRTRGGLEPIEIGDDLVGGLVAAAENGALACEIGEALGGNAGGPVIEALPAIRDGHQFEELRQSAQVIESLRGSLRVYLANLGPLAEHLPRATFARNLFTIAALEVVDGGGTEPGDPEAAARRITDDLAALDDAPIAICLCAADERYDEQALAVTRALRARVGPERRLILAGKPRPELAEAGIDDFIHLGCDVWMALSKIITPLILALDELHSQEDE